MNISIKNLGYIKNAKINMNNDLIIFTGPNLTGKTYLAYTIYGIYKTLRLLSYPIDLVVDKNKIKQLLNTGTIKLYTKKILLDNISKIISVLETQTKNRLPDIFASEKTFFNTSEIKIELNDTLDVKKIFENPIREKVGLGQNIEFNIEIRKDYITIFYKVISPEKENHSNSYSIGVFQSIINDFIISVFLRKLFGSAFIAPAERIAINIFSKELSATRNNLVDRLLELQTSKKSSQRAINSLLFNVAQRYSLPIRDSLDIAEDLSNLQKNKSDFEFVSNKIEKEILKGKIKVSKDGMLQYTPIKSKIKNLNIHMAASMIKSLSNLVFYFRHLARKNDVIIIDEPELNLHPDNQRKIARIIGFIINCGFKVIISTHSDYIIRELNNLIMLKSKKEYSEKLIKKYKYKNDELIDFKRIGAYLFKNNTTELIQVTDIGFEVSSIDDEINSLNNSSREIYLSLYA